MLRSPTSERDHVTDLQTRLSGQVYVMLLELVVPAGQDPTAAIETVGRDQGVDVALRELERDAL